MAERPGWNDDTAKQQREHDDAVAAPLHWGGHGQSWQRTGYDQYGREVGEYVPGSSGAEIDRQRYQNLGNEAGARQAPQTNYTQADQDRLLQLGARFGDQRTALDLQRQAAMGLAPSAAQIQMGQGLDSAIRTQQALAASARGPAATALAQSQAAGNTATMQQQTSGDMAALRAREMAEARGAYSQAATAQRQQDLMSQGLTAQQAQFQAEMELKQRALNQQGQLGWEGMAFDVGKAEQDAMIRKRAIEEGHWRDQMAADASSRDATAGNVWRGVGAGLATAGILFSDVRAKEDVQPIGGAPYSPGARGPTWGQPSTLPAPQGGLPAPQQPMLQTRSLLRAPMGPEGQGPVWGGMPSPTMATPATLGNAMPPPGFNETRYGNALPTGAAMTDAHMANASNVDLGQSQMGARLAAFDRPMMISDERAKEQARLEGLRAGMTYRQEQQAAPLVPGVGQLSRAIDAAVAGDEESSIASRAPRAQGNVSGGKKDAEINYTAANFDPLRANPIKQTMDAAPPATWRYKQGLGPPGPQAGPMAQDLARTPIGASMVHRDPQTGLLAIDPNAATRFNLAANALNNERLDRLERGAATKASPQWGKR